MNLVSYSFITLSEVKEALEITSNEFDAALNGYINRAVDIIEKYCGRRFVSTVYTNELYSGDGGKFLNLNNFPITALTGIDHATGDYDNPSWEALDTALFSYNDAGQVFHAIGFYKGFNNYRVSYTAGYALESIPNDIKEAAILIVSYLFTRRKASPDMQSETLGKYSYTLKSNAGSIIKKLELAEILDMYRTYNL